MAATMEGVFTEELREKIINSKIFVVGAGGIGCELLKNLVLTGFRNIDIIDLDTIDVSNLNRQFLFHKQHVGKSKAEVAKESALKFNPNVNITHYHDSVTKAEYNSQFFKKFDVVLGALDNRAARAHVNRLCLAADVPLVESGTAGYLGQVEVMKKGLTQCYECEQKRLPKTFPSCTIRNTPSEPIHCIVWAKHLFNQLFGESDEDQDVSPDSADPELVGNAGDIALKSSTEENGGVKEKVSTRLWAQKCGYDSATIFKKLFTDDVKYLLSMDKLWENRRRPTPLDLNDLPDAVAGSSKSTDQQASREMSIWSIAECYQVFQNSIAALKKDFETLGDEASLVWDKDDKNGMDFVTACANIRAYIFGIQQKPRFEVKSMAGNIIPAIATTNAITAGVVVLRAMRVLLGQIEECPNVYLRKDPNHAGKLLYVERSITPRNPNCIICGSNPEVTLSCNINKMTVKELDELVLKKELNMVAPDVILALSCNIILSGDDYDEENKDKTLNEFSIKDGSELIVDDFLQSYKLSIKVKHFEAARDEPEFIVHRFDETLGPKPEEEKEKPTPEVKPSTSNDVTQVEEDDDLIFVETDEQVETTPKKRKLAEDEETSSSPPKKRLREVVLEDQDDCIMID